MFTDFFLSFHTRSSKFTQNEEEEEEKEPKDEILPSDEEEEEDVAEDFADEDLEYIRRTGSKFLADVDDG